MMLGFTPSGLFYITRCYPGVALGYRLLRLWRFGVQSLLIAGG